MSDAHQSDIEGQHRALGEHDDGAARAHRVADAELVEHVGIGAGDVGHRVVAEHQPLEHGLVYRAADLFLVAPYRFEAGLLDRRRNHFVVDRIEVGAVARRVQLETERHQHEEQGDQFVGICH